MPSRRGPGTPRPEMAAAAAASVEAEVSGEAAAWEAQRMEPTAERTRRGRRACWDIGYCPSRRRVTGRTSRKCINSNSNDGPT
ncbi:hypothetical protein ACHAXS_000315 [Conticribra weissflogii]